MTSERLRPETLDFIFEYTKDAPEKQEHEWEASEAKMVQIFSASSVVVGLAGIAGRMQPPDVPMTILLVVTLVAYLCIASSLVSALWPRGYRHSRQVGWLWQERWNDSVSDIKHSLVVDISSAYEHNLPILKLKTDNILFGLIFMSVETVAVAAALIWPRLA